MTDNCGPLTKSGINCSCLHCHFSGILKYMQKSLLGFDLFEALPTYRGDEYQSPEIGYFNPKWRSIQSQCFNR